MIYLGISEEHDAGVTALKNGKIIFATNEERYTRKKFQFGFPHESLKETLMFLRSYHHNDPILGIGIASKIHITHPEIALVDGSVNSLSHTIMSVLNRLGLGRFVLGSHQGVAFSSFIYQKFQINRLKRLKVIFDHYGLDKIPLSFFDHHYSHATSAYFTSGFDQCLVVTLDGSGDGYCSKVYKCRGGKMEFIHSIPFYHSIGYYYALVTMILGFKPGQEGKVTGLSAFGNPSITQKVFRELIPYDSDELRFDNRRKSGFFDQEELKMRLINFSKEDIAAGIQMHLEQTVVEYLEDIIRNYMTEKSDLDIALAGGIFANILLNQKISEMKNVSKIFVHPHMGDGGLATGAAYAMMIEKKEVVIPYELTSACLAGCIKEADIERELDKKGLKYEKVSHIQRAVAKLISGGKVVVRVKGRMEYGPRALGHRSILYQAADSSTDKWLNKRLNRSEFMPFAPVILEEDADDYFYLNGQSLAARFMTVTCQTTELCRRKCPGIVHIDGTARPQLVNAADNVDLYDILSEYKAMTGISLFINTSFNMHEEPIAYNISSVLETFLKTGLEFIAIENYLVHQIS